MQARDTDNIGNKTQNEDKQSTTHQTVKDEQHGVHQKTKGERYTLMKKYKRTNNDLQNIHIRLKIE